MGLASALKKQRPFDSSEEEVTLNVMRTGDSLQFGFTRLFKGHGISSPLYNVLRILRGEGTAIPCLEVASRMVTRVPDITRLIDRLELLGLVNRARTDEDRRVVLIAITEAGAALLDQLEEPVRDLHRRQLGHLTPEEMATLNRLLVKAREFEPF